MQVSPWIIAAAVVERATARTAALESAVRRYRLAAFVLAVGSIMLGALRLW
jgi:hypothetical protein